MVVFAEKDVAEKLLKAVKERNAQSHFVWLGSDGWSYTDPKVSDIMWRPMQEWKIVIRISNNLITRFLFPLPWKVEKLRFTSICLSICLFNLQRTHLYDTRNKYINISTFSIHLLSCTAYSLINYGRPAIYPAAFFPTVYWHLESRRTVIAWFLSLNKPGYSWEKCYPASLHFCFFNCTLSRPTETRPYATYHNFHLYLIKSYYTNMWHTCI